MNKEIKFRVWDKTINYMDSRVRVSHFKGIVEVLDSWSTWRELKNGEYELMQYTGLKDKNGVEIYEGDIVRSKNGTLGLTNEHVVEWNDFYKRFDPMGADESCFNRDNCEVIGNIYESPELLKEG